MKQFFLQIVPLSLIITSDYSIKRIKTYHIHAHVGIRTSYKHVPIFITIKVPELCLKMAVIFFIYYSNFESNFLQQVYRTCDDISSMILVVDISAYQQWLVFGLSVIDSLTHDSSIIFALQLLIASHKQFRWRVLGGRAAPQF